MSPVQDRPGSRREEDREAPRQTDEANGFQGEPQRRHGDGLSRSSSGRRPGVLGSCHMTRCAYLFFVCSHGITRVVLLELFGGIFRRTVGAECAGMFWNGFWTPGGGADLMISSQLLSSASVFLTLLKWNQPTSVLHSCTHTFGKKPKQQRPGRVSGPQRGQPLLPELGASTERPTHSGEQVARLG